MHTEMRILRRKWLSEEQAMGENLLSGVCGLTAVHQEVDYMVLGLEEKFRLGDKDLRVIILGSENSVQSEEMGGPRGTPSFGINTEK